MAPPTQPAPSTAAPPQTYDMTADDTVDSQATVAYPEAMPQQPQADNTQDSQATVEYPEQPAEDTLEYSDAESALHTYTAHRAQRQGNNQDFMHTDTATTTLTQLYTEALEDDLASACQQHETDIRAFVSRMHPEQHNTETEDTWTKEQAFWIVPGPWREPVCFYVDLRKGSCYRVDDTSDFLTIDDFFKHEDQIREADKKEIAAFVRTGIFKPVKTASARKRPCESI